MFAYTITIRNEGEVPAKLLTRHWIITDANGRVQEVRGDGVVGEQPYLKPGQGFRYSSGAVLETPVGAMQGSYQMVADDGATVRRAHPRVPAGHARHAALSARARGDGALGHRRRPGLCDELDQLLARIGFSSDRDRSGSSATWSTAARTR